MKAAFGFAIAFLFFTAGIQGRVGSMLAAFIDPGALEEGVPTSDGSNSNTVATQVLSAAKAQCSQYPVGSAAYNQCVATGIAQGVMQKVTGSNQTNCLAKCAQYKNDPQKYAQCMADCATGNAL